LTNKNHTLEIDFCGRRTISADGVEVTGLSFTNDKKKKKKKKKKLTCCTMTKTMAIPHINEQETLKYQLPVTSKNKLKISIHSNGVVCKLCLFF
jgi:hypothetical protein